MPTPRILVTRLAAAALALASGPAHAQSKMFVALGMGAARVAEPAVDAARLAPSVNARVGLRFNPALAVMLEYSLTGIHTLPRDSTGSDAGSVGDTNGRPPLQTEALLLSMQFGSRRLYARPSAGWSRHRFPVRSPPLADNDGPADGAAAALAVGRRIVAIPGAPIALEAVGIWTTGGEEGDHPRWSAGVQLTTEFRF